MYLCGWNTKYAYHRGGTTCLPVPTIWPDDGFWTGLLTPNTPALIRLLWVDRWNRPQGKCGENDWDKLPCRSPSLFNQSIITGNIIRACRRADYCQCIFGVQRYQPFVTDSHLQQKHPRVKTENRWPQYMVRVQALFPLSSSRTAESDHHCRKGGIYGGGTNYLRCTAPPTRRTPLCDRQI